MVHAKKVPMRKCVVTNEMKPKRELVRVVRNKDGEVFVDPTGKKNGRGAYVTKQFDVIDKAQTTKALERQLNTTIDPSIYKQLKQLIEGNKIE
ncbi:YlxR family protein [Aquibacillus sp. 3ASR75-11]|uniref:YlxR family protein n=1 Tax=Terrihalobacillus insolitus TaxID=2950438 RepID=A0A9X3WRV9_9BACI|nr:YlxR family protein [Terrihalobacillus insolitus]MDC3414102.1 YlxR family protein [Terrihalobacillus insolitus]MDC3423543.1 YlxR family protein [Terrihalobacillus insolitus]